MENTDRAASRLAELLTLETDAYSEILQIEREKEEAITANDAERLLEVLSREEPAVEKAGSLERQILACRDELAAQVPGGGGNLTLREIIAGLEPPESDELESLRVKLFGFAEEIRRVNHTNYLLLKQSIELLEEVLSAVLGEGSPCNTYQGNGRIKPGAGCHGTLSVEA